MTHAAAHPAPQDPGSVHLSGVGRAAELAETRRAEAEAWRRKVVVDNVDMRTALPQRPAHVSQVGGGLTPYTAARLALSLDAS